MDRPEYTDTGDARPFDETISDSETKRRGAVFIGLIQLVFVIGVIGAALALSALLNRSNNEQRPDLADLRGNSEIMVRTITPAPITYAPEVRVNGTVQASAEVSVSPQVSGEIKRVSASFRPGTEVKKGDLLFEIDRADYILAVERAEAEIAAARSDLAQLEAEAVLAVEEWEQLFPDEEVNELAARIPQIEAAKARLASANASKRTSELSLERTRVRAPMDARVIASNLDIGQIVSPGQSVGRLVALDSIELSVPVSQEQLAILDPALGRTANFQRRGVTSEMRAAETVRLDASLDARTRLLNLYLLPDTQANLRIGDFVDVTLTADKIAGALTIPASALTGQASVWVVEDGKLAAREVIALGEREDGSQIILAPFDLADGVVIIPPLDVEEGQDVTIREAPTVADTGGRGDGVQ